SDFIGYCQLLMNASHNETVKATPFELLYGYKARLPFDTIFTPTLAELVRSEQLQKLTKMRDEAKEYIIQAQKKMADRINPTRKQHDFKVGDLVRVKSEARKIGLSQKLRRM